MSKEGLPKKLIPVEDEPLTNAEVALAEGMWASLNRLEKEMELTINPDKKKELEVKIENIKKRLEMYSRRAIRGTERDLKKYRS